MSLDEIGATLRELWISYNQIEKLDGLNPCVKLEVLYISNNKIANWGEVQKLSSLNAIKSVLLVGNPIYDECS
jgi:dynein light chain 1